MDNKSEDPQFDSFLGGNQTVPKALNLSEFIKFRMEEVVMLTEAIEESPFRGQAFQRLPKHMRRRQMSHYIKRLPRRLQRPYLLSLKDEPPVPTKRPSRKYRRRPGNLLLEYNRRQKQSVWLETHIWHAKRFHMTTKWGYKLPEKPVNKSFRACYSALSEHCLLTDMSYYNCIELNGSEIELVENLKRCTSTECGLTFGAKMYLSGTREGKLTLFHPDSYPYNVIGCVTFMWQPYNDGYRKIWIWVHPQMYDEVVECFKLLFDLTEVSVQQEVIVEKEYKMTKGNKKSKKNVEEIKLETKNVPFVRTPKFTNKSMTVTMNCLKDTLNRFRLSGPLSQSIVSQAFTVASIGEDSSEVEILGVETKKRKMEEEIQEIKEDKRNWWEKYYGNEKLRKCWYLQKNWLLSGYSRPSDMPSSMVLGLVVEDPRLRIPAKREKAVAKVEDSRQLPATSITPNHSQSPIWIPEIRDEVSTKKLTTQQINEARSKKIVPGTDVRTVIPDDMQSRIPILLVQQPGNSTQKLGLGSGWDIIAPAGFGMPIWLALIFRGARTGGLEETELLRLECNSPSDLPPDSAAGEMENRNCLQKLKTRYFKLPPNKRANFTKLGVVSPFYPPWKVLVGNWSEESDKGKFRVLRNTKMLQELAETVSRIPKGSPDYQKYLKSGSDCLVPVVIDCSGKGKPKDLALICLPVDKDLKEVDNPPTEPTHADGNEESRKQLKSEHSKCLKSLKRKRRKDRGKLKEEFANNMPGKLKWRDILKSNSAPSESHSRDFQQKMDKLWLPDVDELENVADSCCRRVLGFVTKGAFSYSRSRGLAIGYVTLPGLLEVLKVCVRNKSKAVVLVRNTNQVQYRFGRLRIVLE